MEYRVAIGLMAALASSADAYALTKMRDGFANMLVTDGTSVLPRNPVTRAHAGDDVYFWVQWQEPVPRSTLRCVVKGPDTDIDETENFAEAEGEGFSICGLETETSDAGTYVFTQYLNGEKVAERTIVLESEPFFKLSARKKWKWMMGGVVGLFLAGYWVRRKMTGDKRSVTEILGGEAESKGAVREAIVIGSRIPGGGGGAAAASAAPKDDGALDLRKLGMQYQTMMQQADRKVGLELGQRYIGLLLKARNEPEAVKVFRECVAADPAFRLAQADEVLPMAKAARTAGDSRTAVVAVRGFDKAHPGHALIPEVFVFSAKLMAEDLDNKEMARKILAHVVQRYPGHYIAQEARQYLQAMEKSA